ncbi:J domain-containing protein [Agrilutibacter solisilvae]|uniref:J domain-containing protein n=1 Tax=Agrilutibacter solisilvae TaxID=2763317 RepID=A0A974XZU5_9GAMM|nr:J domain-containing protein [Lysobacter solisilvae]QSX77973.1 J domain-containing protein [Lysobacter solisilvae]
MRDAPEEVIRAAYRSLSQKYHPDKNLGDGQAAQRMAVINAAYAVLSDPVRRLEHDEWISRQEQRPAEQATQEGQTRSEPFGNAGGTSGRATPGTSPHEPYQPRPAASGAGVRSHLGARPPRKTKAEHVGRLVRVVFTAAIAAWPITLLAGFFIYSQFADPAPPPPGPAPYVREPSAEPAMVQDAEGAIDSSSQNASTAVESSDQANAVNIPRSEAVRQSQSGQASYLRPALAPNGKAWPSRAGYMTGEPRLNTRGLSEVTVDNTENDSDVLVKLVAIGSIAKPVRQFFIPAHGAFTVRKVNVGHYDVRYRELDTGALARSEAFDLEEERVADGTRYSSIRLTLFKVANGNMQTYSLSEGEF